jgi:hypothetical protein
MNTKKLTKSNFLPKTSLGSVPVYADHFNDLHDDISTIESTGTTNTSNISTNTSAITVINARATHTMDTSAIVKYPLMCTVVYDFAVDGGGSGFPATIDLNSGTAMLPDNAVVVNVLQDVITAPDSTASGGTIKFKLPTDGDLTANITADGGTSGLTDGSPDWTATNMIKTTGARKIQVEIGTEALTAGKIQLYVFYVVSQ